MTTAPWKPANAPSSMFSLGTYVGNLLLITIGGCHNNWKVGQEWVPAIRAAAVVLDGPEAGKEWPDALMFATIVVDQFRNDPGGIVLGRVCAKPGRGNNAMYWIDAQISPADDALARSWDAAYPGRLAQLQQLTVANFMSEESKLNGGHPAPQSQAAPPPPPPPPAYAPAPAAPAAPPAPPAPAVPAFPPPPPANPPAVQSGPPPWAGAATSVAPATEDTPPY